MYLMRAKKLETWLCIQEQLTANQNPIYYSLNQGFRMGKSIK